MSRKARTGKETGAWVKKRMVRLGYWNGYQQPCSDWRTANHTDWRRSTWENTWTGPRSWLLAEAQGTGQGRPPPGINGVIFATPAISMPFGLRPIRLIQVQRMAEQLERGPRVIIGHPSPRPPPRPVPRARRFASSSQPGPTGSVGLNGGMSRMDPCVRPPGVTVNQDADMDEKESPRKRARFT